MKLRQIWLAVVSVCVLTASARAEVQPAMLFADNMVLQRDTKVPIWGWADPDAAVSVSFAGQTVTGKADKDGRWRVELAPLKSELAGRDLTIASGGKTVTLKNVVVGDVWICSGQSNMQLDFTVHFANPADLPKEEVPNVRLFYIRSNRSSVPVWDIKSSTNWPPEEQRASNSWKLCTLEYSKGFSQVGYYFAQTIQKDQKVPVGMILAAVGSTTVGQWTSAEAQAKASGSKPRNAPPSPVRYAAEPATGKKGPLLFNGMIHPLVGMAFKGFLWYQGESEAAWFFNDKYDRVFVELIRDLRARWGVGDFPFLFVQIQSGTGKNDARIREMQAKGLSEPNTAMAVIADVCRGLHPSVKRPVGERLALAARALAYGQKIEYMGPIFKTMTIEGDKVRLTFEHVGGGLVAKGGGPLSKAAGTPVDPKLRTPPSPFVIAGADGVFLPADAVIDGATVLVSNPAVPKPTAVRYGWDVNPALTLFNKEALPASPFRTDGDGKTN